ncbi:hypothetical protein V6N13_020501 [Hibiscus sabdariffa]
MPPESTCWQPCDTLSGALLFSQSLLHNHKEIVTPFQDGSLIQLLTTKNYLIWKLPEVQENIANMRSQSSRFFTKFAPPMTLIPSQSRNSSCKKANNQSSLMSKDQTANVGEQSRNT